MPTPTEFLKPLLVRRLISHKGSNRGRPVFMIAGEKYGPRRETKLSLPKLMKGKGQTDGA